MSIASNSRTVGRTTVRGGIDCTHSSANTFKSGWETIARRARNAPKERHRTTEPASNGLQVWEAPTQPTAARPRVQGRSPGGFPAAFAIKSGAAGGTGASKHRRPLGGKRARAGWRGPFCHFYQDTVSSDSSFGSLDTSAHSTRRSESSSTWI